MQMSSSSGPAFLSVPLLFSQASPTWPSYLAAERCACVQAGKQGILNWLVKVEHLFQMSCTCLQQGPGMVSQQGEDVQLLERVTLDRNIPWCYMPLGAGTHRPVLDAMSISGFGHEKPKASWYIMTAHQSVGRAGSHSAAELCSAGAFSPSSPWADQATTLHPRLIAGSWPKGVLWKSKTFSILASASKGLQPQTGVLQFSQVYFPRRSACSPLSPELQPRSVMNNVLDASSQCTSPRWTHLLSPVFPQCLSHSAQLDPPVLVTCSLVAACKDGRDSRLVGEWSQRHQWPWPSRALAPWIISYPVSNAKLGKSRTFHPTNGLHARKSSPSGNSPIAAGIGYSYPVVSARGEHGPGNAGAAPSGDREGRISPRGAACTS